MEFNEILNILDNSWSRDEVLLKIKNGEDPEKIINEFISNNKQHIKNLSKFLKPEDKYLLNQIEKLSNVEANLINKISNISSFNNELSSMDQKRKNTSIKEIVLPHKFGLFMMKWSNKFVFIALLTMSAIALSKQAWA